MFGAYGGLTCFYGEELSRDGIFGCLRKRHHYGTTGNRIYLTVDVEFETSGELFNSDPNVYKEEVPVEVDRVMMGDIVRTDDETVLLKVTARSPTPIERIEIRNGINTIKTVRGYDKSDLGNRYRVVWCGAEYRGRGRNTSWIGEAVFGGAKIVRMEKINAWNHERLLEVQGENRVKWDAITTGNFGGFDVWLDPFHDAELKLETNHGSMTLKLAEIGMEDEILECGGLERKLKVIRLPDENTHFSLTSEIDVELSTFGDNPLWVCVTTENGFQAWSSPIFVFR